MSTGIEWTDETWNPSTGCDQVSPGCDNCYALTMAKRLKAMGQAKYQTDGDPRTSGPGFGLVVHDDVLEQPLRWRKPRRVFVNSMSDLFHPRVPDEFIARSFAVMAVSERHTFQVLTKRPKRMRALLSDATWVEEVSFEIVTLTVGMGHPEPVWSRHRVGDWWPLPNVWLGTSVEDQRRADERIPALLDTPAAVRFLSCEPLLGPVSLSRWLGARWRCSGCREFWHGSVQETCPRCARVGYWTGSVPRLHWVIAGGESGPGARPMHPDWPRELGGECVDHGVPFFFKQWGAWGEMPRAIGGRIDAAVAYDGCHHEHPDVNDPAYRRWALEHDHTRPNRMHAMYRVGKHVAGRDLDGRTWDEMPTTSGVQA